MSLENRVAVITGATGGLGRVASRQFAEAGASLALFSSNQEKLSQLINELALPEERWLTHAVDLREPSGALEAAKLTIEKFGRADILFHLVGGWVGGKTITEFDTESYASMLDQHFWTSLYLLQEFVPLFLENHWGRIIVVSSPVAARPVAKSSPYASAKAAQEALVMSLANEIKQTGVTANVIRVKTIDVGHQKIHTPNDKNAFWTTPEEISKMALFLCSKEANNINGAQIPLYGSP